MSQKLALGVGAQGLVNWAKRA